MIGRLAVVVGLVGGMLVSAACSSAPTADKSVTRSAVTPVGPSAVHRVRPPASRVSASPVLEKAHPKPNRCAHSRAPQRVIVSIAAQHLWMCAHHHLVRQTAVTTGMAGQWTSTPTGDYWIQGRTRDTALTLNTGATYAVKYWIPFDAPLFGFHDSSWQHFPYGSAKYKTAGSHGCVHMPLPAIAFLYRWAARPTAVHIS